MEPKDDRIFGCFFSVVAILAVILFIAIVIGIFAAVDLAYKNWG